MYNDFYLPQENYPDAKLELKQIEKVKFKDILIACIQKKNFSRYLFAGIVIMLGSLIMPYNVYYIVWGSLLLTLSFVCLISPVWQRPKHKDIFG